MAKQSYADNISSSQVMAAALRNNTEKVGRRGIDADFITKLETDSQAAVVLNNEQEKLKAQTKLKTEELDEKLTSISSSLSEARKVVKMEFPQSQWIEFGITDKK